MMQPNFKCEPTGQRASQAIRVKVNKQIYTEDYDLTGVGEGAEDHCYIWA